MVDDNDYHQLNDEANTTIIKNLTLETTNISTKEVLLCYVVKDTGSDIMKQMNKFIFSEIKETAEFLNINTSKTKKQTIQQIVRSIETLLMERCDICNKYYNVTLQEQPLLKCDRCLQGCHRPCFEELSNAIDLKKYPMVKFHCSTCMEDEDLCNTISTPIKTKNSTPIKTKDKQRNDIENINFSTEELLSSPIIPANQYDTELEDDKIKNAENRDKTEKHKEMNPEKSQEREKYTSMLNITKSQTQSQGVLICPKYQNGPCKNYENCKYSHPRRCRNMLTDGWCPYKSLCKYHHPKMCFNSLSKRICPSLGECKFFHVKGTVQTKPVEIPQSQNIMNPEINTFQHTQPCNTNIQPLMQQNPLNRYPTTQEPSGEQPTQRQKTNQEAVPDQTQSFLDQIFMTNTRIEKLEKLLTRLINSQQQNVNSQLKPNIPVTQTQQQPMYMLQYPQTFPQAVIPQV